MKTESYKTKLVDDVPGKPEPGIIYVVKFEDAPKPFCLVLLCPCGCGTHTQLHLQKWKNRPHWNVSEITFGTLTIHPSIQRVDGCKSHYFIREGKVQWC